MEPYDNPLDVQVPGIQATPNPTPEQQSDIAGQWRSWMANGDNRAALMQFGVSLMSPMGFGQTPAGHVAQGLGSVGEMSGRREAMDLKAQDADSKQELRGAQATAAEARAATAGQGAARSADRLTFQRERLDSDLRNSSTRIRLSGLLRYQQARKAHDDNQLLVPPAQRTSFPAPDEWFRTMGLGDAMGGGSPDGEGANPAPASSNIPPLSSRIKGQTYTTPRGPMVWEGTGWRAP